MIKTSGVHGSVVSIMKMNKAKPSRNLLSGLSRCRKEEPAK
jgi:hypothetical protein